MWTTIKTLWELGYNKTQIAEMIGCSRKTIRKILKQIQQGQVEPKRELVVSIIEPYKDLILARVSQKLTVKRIYQELTGKGYTGSYETVKRFVSRIKLKKDVYMHNVTVAGEEAQIDFGYAGLIADSDGKLKKAWVFCLGLTYSKKYYYEIVFSQKVEDFLNSHINAFRYLGGVPKTIKIDNLKSAILQANFYEPVYQKEYLNFANYYRFKPIPCRIYTPTDKAMIESSIKYVKNSFIRGRRFKDIFDANTQLKEWTETVCNKRIHGTTKRIPDEVFEQEEKAQLLPLPDSDYQIRSFSKRIVSCNCHICFENNFYSVPWQYLHQEVIVEKTGKLIKIYKDNNLIATHQILTGKGNFQTNPSHYPEYKIISETDYQNKYRMKMKEIGPDCEEYFKLMIKQQKGYWSRQAKGLLKLAKEYGNQVVNNACKRAFIYGVTSYVVVKRIIEKNLFEEDFVPKSSIETKTGEFQRPLEEYEKWIPNL